MIEDNRASKVTSDSLKPLSILSMTCLISCGFSVNGEYLFSCISVVFITAGFVMGFCFISKLLMALLCVATTLMN